MRHLAFLISVLCLWSGSLIAEGKLEIRSNAPHAQVYLDGTLIGNADARGRLHIDQLPDGRFMITIKKSGFSSESRTIEILPNHTSEAFFELAAIRREVPPPREARPQPGRKPSQSPAVSSSTPRSQPIPAAAPVAAKEPATGDHRNILYVSVAVIAICALIITFFFLKTQFGILRPAQMQDSLEAGAADHLEPSGPLPIESSKATGDAAFLAELEHREELLRAGFLADAPKSKARRPLEEPGEKTITLNKDEYEVKD
ncbi:MAG: PEGA domain-containing protein [Acidobacteriia bacterium]|nr:PEGA domain-containing protein [Terriglobia bacterium]